MTMQLLPGAIIWIHKTTSSTNPIVVFYVNVDAKKEGKKRKTSRDMKIHAPALREYTWTGLPHQDAPMIVLCRSRGSARSDQSLDGQPFCRLYYTRSRDNSLVDVPGREVSVNRLFVGASGHKSAVSPPKHFVLLTLIHPQLSFRAGDWSYSWPSSTSKLGLALQEDSTRKVGHIVPPSFRP